MIASSQSHTAKKAYMPTRISKALTITIGAILALTLTGAVLFDRGEQGAFGAPPSLNPAFDSAGGEALFSFPLGHAESFAVELEHHVRSMVVGLRTVVRPSAIARLVVPINVDAVDRVPGRPRAHVFNEGLEAVQPPLAHANAAAAVVLVTGEIRIRAASLRHCPRGICGRTTLAVRLEACAIDVGLQAAAALNITAAQVFADRNFCISTVAAALPRRPAITEFYV